MTVQDAVHYARNDCRLYFALLCLGHWPYQLLACVCVCVGGGAFVLGPCASLLLWGWRPTTWPHTHTHTHTTLSTSFLSLSAEQYRAAVHATHVPISPSFNSRFHAENALAVRASVKV